MSFTETFEIWHQLCKYHKCCGYDCPVFKPCFYFREIKNPDSWDMKAVADLERRLEEYVKRN